MKKLLAIPALAAILAAALYVQQSFAQQTPGYAQTPTIGRHWESLGVATGAIIQSPVLDLSNVNECIAYADNSAGGSTRALTADCMGADGTTVIFRVSNTVAISGRGLITWGRSVSAASAPTGVTIQPSPTCKKMQFTLASAGAAAGSLAIDCR